MISCMNAKELYEQFTAYYETYVKTRVIDNLFEVIHISENDHTNILAQIFGIKINNDKPFIKSFLYNLGIETRNKNLTVSTQSQAISLNGVGYIDLLITVGEDTAVVVENKVCGATDTQYQLQRYYCSLRKDEQAATAFIDKFHEYWKDEHRKEYKDIHIVYLTSDGSKSVPTDSDTTKNYSITKQLKESLGEKFHEVNYLTNVLSWLYDDVLPKLPVKGNILNSIKLYVDYLEQALCINDTANNEWLRDEKLKELFNVKDGVEVSRFCEFDRLYKELIRMKKANKDDSPTTGYLYDELTKRILCFRNSIFSKMAPEGWDVYATTGYIKVFKPEWKESFGGQKFSTVSFSIFGWSTDSPSFCVSIENNSYITQKDLQSKLEAEYGKAKHTSGKYFSLTLNKVKLSFKADKEFFVDFVNDNTIKKITDEIDKALTQYK